MITTTQHLKRHLINHGIQTNHVFVLPNMLPDPIKAMHISSQQHPKLIIGSLGRFVEKKGFHDFIEALYILKSRGHDFKGVLAGEGEEREKLLSLREHFQLHDHLAIKPWVEPSVFFNEIDIFCLPSLHEPFGIVLIEAFAYQKAVVTTKSEGPSEIAEDGISALMTPMGNPTMLADKLEILLLNPADRLRLALKGREVFEKRYAIEVVSNTMKNIVLKLAPKHALSLNP